MAEDQLLVDGELFLGRLEEQNTFRQALREALGRDYAGQSAQIFLVIGQVGMGKSKLLRRLRDIAARESPFEATCQTMLVDLDIERVGSTIFQERRSAGQDRDVFAILYRAARDAGWGHQFSEYQSTLRQLTRVEKKFSEALEQESWGRKYNLINRMPAEEILAIYRREDIPSRTTIAGDGRPVEPLRTPTSPDQARAWAQVDSWFASRIKFEDQEEAIFKAPNTSFTNSLAGGFTKISGGKPLIVLLDSFEYIGEGDRWLRAIIRSSGPRIVWVLGSKEDVSNSGLTPGEAGYADEFKDKLRVFHLTDLSIENVVSYLSSRAPDRLITRENAERIYSLTQGLPLALQLCGDLWASGVPAIDIIDGAPKAPADRAELIEFVSHRFLDIAVAPVDRKALVFLAIQPRTDMAVLGAVVEPGRGAYELREHMTRLSNRYFAIRFSGGIRFHPAVKEVLSHYLLRSRIRISDEVKVVASIAARLHESNRSQLEASFGRLEDRFGNSDWRDSVLDSLYWNFLDNEFNAWRQMTPDFIDSLGYDLPFAKNLTEIAESLESIFSKTGRQRLGIFLAWNNLDQRSESENWTSTSQSLDSEISMFAELERWLVRYGSRDLNASERRAILDLRRGETLARRGQFEEAMSLFLKVEKNLPPRGQSLAQQLASDFETLGERLAWRRGGYRLYAAMPSPGAETSLKRAIAMGIRNAKVYHTLGVVQVSMGKFEAALENLLQTVTMSPDNELAWNDLGDVYRKQDLFEKAIPAYRRAVEINLNFIFARLALAMCYRQLEQMTEYRTELEACRALIGEEDYYLRACYEAVAEDGQAALANLKLASERDQISLDQIKRNPSLDYIRTDPEFETAIAPR
jgi:tetratricopeptide (TPR) repeat protein